MSFSTSFACAASHAAAEYARIVASSAARVSFGAPLPHPSTKNAATAAKTKTHPKLRFIFPLLAAYLLHAPCAQRAFAAAFAPVPISETSLPPEEHARNRESEHLRLPSTSERR